MWLHMNPFLTSDFSLQPLNISDILNEENSLYPDLIPETLELNIKTVLKTASIWDLQFLILFYLFGGQSNSSLPPILTIHKEAMTGLRYARC